MISIILKFIYLSVAAGLGVISIRYEKLINKKVLIPILIFSIAYCFGFWGVLSVFNVLEGYPSYWFFYTATAPVWVVVLIVLLNIKKK